VESVTARVRAAFATGMVTVIAMAGCSGSSSDPRAKRSTASTTTTRGTTTTTTAAKGPSSWVQQWDSVLVTDYGPAQEAFLRAVQTARVADVQAAILAVKAANEKLGMAITAAGDPPPSDAAARAKLQTGLADEYSLIPMIQTACIGKDPKCQTLVTRYLDNNKDTIVPALTELRAAT
jgi:hypothetical protein